MSVVSTSREPLALIRSPSAPRTEAREHDAVDRADPDGGEHGDDRLGAGRHVDREAVALADAEAAQAGGDPLDLGEQLGVRAGRGAHPARRA